MGSTNRRSSTNRRRRRWFARQIDRPIAIRPDTAAFLGKDTMLNITRRSFTEMAAAIGATAAWVNPFAAESRTPWRERRDLFVEGVASGNPDGTSVLLWTPYSTKGTNAPVELR